MKKTFSKQIRLPLFSVALLFAVLFISASAAKATSYGLTVFDYSVQGGFVTGTHETYLDMNDRVYYAASVNGWLLDYGNDETLQNYQIVDNDSQDAPSYAAVQTFGYVQRGRIYATYSIHSVIARLISYPYYRDPYGFSNGYTDTRQPRYTFSYGYPVYTTYQRIPVAATGVFVALPNITGLTVSNAEVGQTKEVEILGKYIGEHINVAPVVTVSGTGVTATVTRIIPGEGVVVNIQVASDAVPGERQLSLQSGYAPNLVPSNSVPFTVTRTQPNITSISPEAAIAGNTYVVQFRGTFGPNPTVQVSGTGVTTNYRDALPDGFEANFQIDENAPRGDRQVTVTNSGLTSNAVTFRVGDRTPVITSISRQQGEMGEILGVTITGQDFGLNPLIQFDGTGILPTIQTQSPTQITATFAIGDQTYEGQRGVKIKSFGIAGTGFTTSPGASDTSNAVPFNVLPLALSPQIPPIQAVGKNDVIRPFVVITPFNNTRDVQLRLTTVTGTGQAIFTQTGNNTLTIQQTQAVEIKGVTESSEVNNIKIEALYNGRALNSRVFTVVTIDSLIYEKLNNDIPNDLNLTANPGTGNPATAIGLRIFPDKEDPVTDTRTRNAVLIKATVKPAIANLQVYFANFDPDDPSSDTAPLDPNATAGDDNNGLLKLGGRVTSKAGFFVKPDASSTCTVPTSVSTGSQLQRANCPTGTDGVAKINFIVGVQPGDNFAVAASAGEVYRDGITLNPTDGTKLSDSLGRIIPISGQPSSGDATVPGIRTDLLTVWRRLHIEVDRMTPVPNTTSINNHVIGTLAGGGILRPNTPTTIPVAAAGLEDNRFENGRVLINGRNYRVVENTKTTIVITSLTTAVFTDGDSFVMYDDDDYNKNQTQLTLNGDEGEAITEHLENGLPILFSHLSEDSGIYLDGSLKNVLGQAYILPEYTWARNKGYNQDNVDFDLNVETSNGSTTEADTVLNQHRDSTNDELDNFWIAYFVVGYQGNLKEDGDGRTYRPGTNDYLPDPFEEGLTIQKYTSLRIPCDCLNSPLPCPSFHVSCSTLPIGGDGSILFEETTRDSVFHFGTVQNPPVNTKSWEILAVHEIGHQFGLAGDKKSTDFLIMDYPNYALGASAPTIEYHPEHLNIMRRRIKSPGVV